MSTGGLFDFGLVFFHNAKEQIARGAGPFYYLPKMESHLEARLWNDIFVMAQDHVGLPQGTIKATVVVETILATFEMEEILFEVRNHSAGLDTGHWDYIFSCIKKFKKTPTSVWPSATPWSAVHAWLRPGPGAGLQPAAANDDAAVRQFALAQ